MTLDKLETPSLIVDVNVFENNIRAMNEIISGTSLKLRPHYKSHKCAAISRMQIKNGAKGITCAKLSEAIDLYDAGIEDILIANQIVEDGKIRKMTEIASDCRLTVCVDNAANIVKINESAKLSGSTVHCLIEYDIGMGRCGVTDEESVLRLAELIGSSSNLVFDGIQAYAGHLSHEADSNKREKLTNEYALKLKSLLKCLENASMKADILSGGSTGTSVIKAKIGLYNELQAGSYIFMDSTYSKLDLPFKNSMFVLSTVVSAREGLTVVDSGVKTCGVDQGMPEIYGNSSDYIVASEEHFQLHGLKNPASIGDKLLLIPGHCCSTVNLHDKLYICDGNKIIDRLSITGRGMGR